MKLEYLLFVDKKKKKKGNCSQQSCDLGCVNRLLVMKKVKKSDINCMPTIEALLKLKLEYENYLTIGKHESPKKFKKEKHI